MVVTIEPELESALQALAQFHRVGPEELALRFLRERLLAGQAVEPRDNWECELLQAARPWGVSLSDAALSGEGLYD